MGSTNRANPNNPHILRRVPLGSFGHSATEREGRGEQGTNKPQNLPKLPLGSFIPFRHRPGTGFLISYNSYILSKLPLGSFGRFRPSPFPTPDVARNGFVNGWRRETRARQHT